MCVCVCGGGGLRVETSVHKINNGLGVLLRAFCFLSAGYPFSDPPPSLYPTVLSVCVINGCHTMHVGLHLLSTIRHWQVVRLCLPFIFCVW